MKHEKQVSKENNKKNVATSPKNYKTKRKLNEMKCD